MPCRPEALRPRLSAAPTASCSLAAVIPTRLASLLDSLRPLAERFSARDHRLYLVGGSVRDLLLGGDRLPEDLDFTTDASPEQITIFESQGMAIQDIAVAVRLEAMAREQGLGVELPYGG